MVDPVKVKNDGTVGLGDATQDKVSLAASPKDVKADADTIMEDGVATDAWIEAPFFWAS